LTPVVGFLHAGSPEQNIQRLAAYRKGLSDTGFVEGQNVTKPPALLALADEVIE
jgi:hypothetical protein